MTDWKELLEGLRKLTNSEPENAVAWYNLGFAYANHSRYDDAIEAYRQVIRINPEHAYAWYSLGNAYANLTSYDAAIEAYLGPSASTRRVPGHGLAWGSFITASPTTMLPSTPSVRSPVSTRRMPSPGTTSGSLTATSTAPTTPSRLTVRPCVSTRRMHRLVHFLSSQLSSKTGVTLGSAGKGRPGQQKRNALPYMVLRDNVQDIVHFLWRPQLPDPKDDHLLELAIAANGADIVTHNVRDFTQAATFRIRILTPAQLLGDLK